MRRTSVQIFKHYDGNFVLFLRQFFGKTSEELWERYAIIGTDIDIDTIEKYRYWKMSISIDTFPITTTVVSVNPRVC